MTSDKTLAKKATRDPQAFGDLFDRYALRIYRYCYSRVQHRESAEDITAQVFQDALEHIAQYQPSGPFVAWLFTIARRRVADHYRKSKPTEALTEELSQGNPEFLAGVIQEENLQQLENSLQTLEDNELELLRLRFAAGMRYREIAALVDKTPGAVKIATYRLLDRLKAKMEKTDDSQKES
jgi:RNA polymerase sigma-70 factor (ECF subfamily)